MLINFSLIGPQNKQIYSIEIATWREIQNKVAENHKNESNTIVNDSFKLFCNPNIELIQFNAFL